MSSNSSSGALVKNYSYILNSTALTPEEFLAQDGGDCEDWSIVTAGLLQFWDVPAYVGTLSCANRRHRPCCVSD